MNNNLPAFIVEVEDHDGVSWEVDINSESDIDLLLSIRSLLAEVCIDIHYQLSVSDGDIPWEVSARRSLKHYELNIKLISKRIKYLQDPTGSITAINRLADCTMTKNSKELISLRSFLSTSHPFILDAFDLLNSD